MEDSDNPSDFNLEPHICEAAKSGLYWVSMNLSEFFISCHIPFTLYLWSKLVLSNFHKYFPSYEIKQASLFLPKPGTKYLFCIKYLVLKFTGGFLFWNSCFSDFASFLTFVPTTHFVNKNFHKNKMNTVAYIKKHQISKHFTWYQYGKEWSISSILVLLSSKYL